MKILGIETSCDETSVAVLEVKNNKIKILSNIVSSQVKIHAPFGGIVPGLAAREHEKNLAPVFKKALKEAELKMEEIDLISVTIGPGLEIALWKGINLAKSVAQEFKKSLIAANHLEGHIYSNFLNSNKIKFPALNLIVSGGHTQLVLMTGHGEFKIIGETQDDAAGEAFDKVARMIKLGYPGGPAISKIAEKGDSKKFNLPRPMLNQKNYNFSFSGLKTAVLYLLKDLGEISKKTKADISASFQQAVIDVLVQKTIKAAKEYRVKSILLSGGVSANKLLRKTLQKEAKKLKLFYSQPNLQYTGDNAAMMAMVGYYKFKYKKYEMPNSEDLIVDANLSVKNW
ncbi:MAG: tRNA (adenosine(37)-N6)-threonylcarbamoyltransferase complex transferase subunit TsaD [Parcubacteria group bacterium RIFCSPLOWO2_01_FULL_40_65]|nr:MAG: tRNA (adenosine(37)-N6)-threonylcarbamoyltransferase complex transferase subunit TsaD [Parcubacteria group bacterium RIFCSPHIGHO2_01_FULL_40_30]OHB19428.1 MAG: tRNA (adenosine(37)-N6)-threonylcarbamoyltransferase complex transferase subunit TsaD [Parcubacteria group bacterium RIFCSPHIGHO2_02_FULL_40_12]OHB21127.1 MAG: tRNA (adenosine(37)-N6)-threonylcarbamoyltransferase complex transferase subunit TsaD [Parcubacteria group bacterium RIFCSPLOWO2_01_FULL_40_65]OHB23455.1 MAG: tRNA (adenosi